MVNFKSLNNKAFLILTFLCAAVIRLFFATKNFSLSPDIATQLNTLVNFYNGLGPVQIFFNGKITEEIIHQNHPPGFIIISYIFFHFLKNPVNTAYLINVFSEVFIILFAMKLLLFLRMSKFQTGIILLFFSFIVSPFYTCWSSDYLATALALWGCFFGLIYLEKQKNIDLLIGVFFFSMAYFVKYSFFPFFFFPISLYLSKATIGRTFNIWTFLKILSLIFFAILSVSLLNFLIIGKSASTIMSVGRFNFYNLKRFDSIFFHFGNYDYRYDIFFKKISNTKINFRSVSILVTIFLFCILLFSLKNTVRKRTWDAPHEILAVMTIALLFLITPFLIMLSIVTAPEIYNNGWTYVESTRYFSPVIVLFNLFLISYLLKSRFEILKVAFATIFMILNLIAFRSYLKVGNYGDDFFVYKNRAFQLMANVEKVSENKKLVVTYNSSEIFSMDFYILKSNGLIFMESNNRNSKTLAQEHYKLIKFNELVSFKNSDKTFR